LRIRRLKRTKRALLDLFSSTSLVFSNKFGEIYLELSEAVAKQDCVEGSSAATWETEDGGDGDGEENAQDGG
jgi:hypothetical protein